MKDIDKIIKENEKLIHKSVQKFKFIIYRSSFEYEDLVQHATIGFIEAYNKYDASKNSKLTTYATKAMYNELLNAIRKNSKDVKFPEYFGVVWKAMEENDTDDANEISNITGVSYDNVRKAIRWKDNQIFESMNKKVKNKKGELDDELVNLIGNESDYSVIYVNDFLKHLDSRTKDIVEMRMEGCTCQEIGDCFNLSRKRISAILQDVSKRYKTLFY